MNEFRIGWIVYVAFLPIECCGTDAMRRGWMAANRAEALSMVAEAYT